MIISTATFSQKLSGKITDATTGAPLQGASVYFSTKNFAVTDDQGLFSLACDKGIVSVSYVGYNPVMQKITSCDRQLNISLSRTENRLNEVEITATSVSNKSLLFQPAAISKLSVREIKRGTGLFLDDAININVPGVSMQRRAVASGQQFNIRGYGNGSRGTRGISSNFEGQGYKVYLNGIPVTDAEGITVMDDIDFGSIGNVEISKGPAGTLYGLAIAGVVNLKTTRPEKGKTSIGQEVLIGNYGLRRYTTRLQTGSENASLLVNYGKQKSAGFMVNHSASKKDFVNAAAEFRANAKQSLTAYAGYANSYDERTGELSVAQYDSMNYLGNMEYLKRNAHSKAVTFRAGLGHIYNFTANISNSTFVSGTSFVSDASSGGGWTDKNSGNFSVRSVFDTKFSLKNNISLSGVTGIETQRGTANTIVYAMLKNPDDPLPVWNFGQPYWIIGSQSSNLTATSATTSVFSEWTLALPQDLSLTGGLGVSNMKLDLEDKFYVAATPNKTRDYDTAYKKMVSPHLAINKVFGKKVSVFAAYSKAYKAPVSAYFFIPYVAGQSQTGIVNSRLKPEKGNQFEIGAKGNILKDKLFFGINLFHTVFSDKMTTVAVTSNNTATPFTLFSYVVNGGKQDDKGAELLLRYKVFESQKGFFQKVTPFFNMAFSDFKYKNFKFESIGKKKNAPLVDSAIVADYSGKDVAGVTKFTANAGIDISLMSGVYANFTYLHRDKMPIISTNTLYTHGYNIVNGKIGIRTGLSKHFDMDAFFGVDNITNSQFPYMIFINQLPDAYVPAPKTANIYGGLNIQYNF